MENHHERERPFYGIPRGTRRIYAIAQKGQQHGTGIKYAHESNWSWTARASQLLTIKTCTTTLQQWKRNRHYSQHAKKTHTKLQSIRRQVYKRCRLSIRHRISTRQRNWIQRYFITCSSTTKLTNENVIECQRSFRRWVSRALNNNKRNGAHHQVSVDNISQQYNNITPFPPK